MFKVGRCKKKLCEALDESFEYELIESINLGFVGSLIIGTMRGISSQGIG